MTPYLVYWKTYWRDGAPSGTRQWSTNSRSFHSAVRPGDTLWIIVSDRAPRRKSWYLLERLRVHRVEPHPEPSPWGKYHLLGDARSTQLFGITRQPDMSGIIWMVTFSPGKPIRATGSSIGLTLQIYRRLSPRASTLLDDYARCLIPSREPLPPA